MSLIVGQDVGKAYGAEYVLEEMSFHVSEGDRIGLVGPNGEGKTTLMRILGGFDEPTTGRLQRRGNLKVGYLPQDPPTHMAEMTLWDSMLEVFGALRRVEAELADLAGRLGDDPDGALLARYGQLQHEYEACGGYSYEQRIKEVLTGLSFPPDRYESPLGQFSGGQRTRALLARLLLDDSDLLLLDEPTNHLDLESVEWLEHFLAEARRGSVVVVSHDRYFLDKVATHIWEIAFAALEEYRGNYTQHLSKRADRLKERRRAYEAQRKYILDTEDYVRRYGAAKRPQQAHGRQTRLERYLATHALEKPREHKTIHLRITPLKATGDLVLRSAGLRAGYDASRPVASAEGLEVRRGRRIALVGPNGAGKTTLLRTLMGDLPALAGTVQWGANVRLGYLPQSHARLRPEWTALQALRQQDPLLKDEQGRNLLGGMGLSGDDAFKRIDQLSGGQRTRVLLAQLALTGPNVLVLDEPTNHLDLPSREIVQSLLSDFEGTLLFVSHDRYLVQALATHVWAIENGVVHELVGGWEKYVEWRTAMRTGTAQGASTERRQRATRREANLAARQQGKQRQKLQKRMEELEAQIEAVEAKLAGLLDAAGAAGEAGDLDLVGKLGEEHGLANQKKHELWEEYEQVHGDMESLERDDP
jgi:ATP-binding cassette subfamily F protein 3